MAKSQYFGLGDRCLETTTTTGTGAITLLGAVTGYRTIMSVVTGSQQFPYVIVGGSEFEVGYGTRTGATTFTRDTVLASSNSGNLVNFSAGTKEVWMDLPSDQIEVLTSARTENLIVNGGCEVSQEFLSNTQLNVQSGNIADLFVAGSAGASRFTLQRSGGGPPGFPSFSKMLVTTADAAIAASDTAIMFTMVEGYRMSRASFGNANAEPLGLGFWAQTSRTGTYTGSISNAAGTRSYTFEYSAVAANWQYHTVIIPGDTTGTWDTTNGVGAYIIWSLMAGSNFTQTAGAWQATASAKRGTANQVNGVASIGDYLQITGVTLIAGNVAVPPHMAPCVVLPWEQELLLCSRYYQKSMAYESLPTTALGTNTGEYSFPATAAGAVAMRSSTFPFRTRMRTPPTVTILNPAVANNQVRDETSAADCSASSATGFQTGFHVATTTDAGAAANFVLGFHWAADSRMA